MQTWLHSVFSRGEMHDDAAARTILQYTAEQFELQARVL